MYNTWLTYVFTIRWIPAHKGLPSSATHHLSWSLFPTNSKTKGKEFSSVTFRKTPCFETKAWLLRLFLNQQRCAILIMAMRIRADKCVDLQVTPSKFPEMALVKLRWALSFTDWHRYADDLYGVRCPVCFVCRYYTLHSSRVRARFLNVNHSSLSQCRNSKRMRKYHHLPLAPAQAGTTEVPVNT